MGVKLYPVIEKEGDIEPIGYMFHCPGCQGYHSFSVNKPNEKGHQWRFNGNLNEPSFEPSLKVIYEGTNGDSDIVCHSFVKNGFITFLNDSTHKMKGMTTVLPDIE